MRKAIAAITLTFLSVAGAAAQTQNTEWQYSTKTAIDGKVTEYAISGYSDSLVIRCSNVCEVFMKISDSIVADQSSVRIKFNNGPLERFAVSLGEGDDSLFFRDPMGILKAIRDNGGYLTVEYAPYQKTPTTVVFHVWNLPPTVLARIEAYDKARVPMTPQERLEKESRRLENEKQLAQQREVHRKAVLAQEDEGERKVRFELCQQGIIKGDRCADVPNVPKHP